MSQLHDTPPIPPAQGPSGLTRRRQRLSDEETARRMLDAALAQVNRTGLTVSLDHIAFEDVIRDAGVSRSAVYRRWPYKDLFVADLLRELAQAATPAQVVDEEAQLEQVHALLRGRLDRLGTQEGRQALGTELFRTVTDFDTIYRSTEWRTYLALHATFNSLLDGELRDEVQHALARSERWFVGRIAANYGALAALLGYRIRPELDMTFETIAELASAALRGLVLMALSDPDLAERRIMARPFGATDRREWTMSGLATAAMAFAFLEPDPDVVWDDARRALVRDAVRAPKRRR